jgi:hypothetical protein
MDNMLRKLGKQGQGRVKASAPDTLPIKDEHIKALTLPENVRFTKEKKNASK